MKRILVPVLVGGLLALGSLGCQDGRNGQQEDGFYENGEQQQNGEMPQNGENGYYEGEDRGMQNGEKNDTMQNGQDWGGDTTTDTTDGMDSLDERAM